MNNQVMIRFECGSEERFSQEFGPFEFVQLTYLELRVGPDGDTFAVYDEDRNRWVLNDDDLDTYSDVVIY